MNVPRLVRNEARIADRCVGIGFGTIRQMIRIVTIFTIIFLTWPVSGEQFGVSRRAASSTASPSPSSARPSPPQRYAADSTLSPLSALSLPKIGSQAIVVSPTGFSADSAKPLPNVVRLIAFDPSGQSFGSGSYIGNFEESGLILSNWHVVCETDGLVHIHFPCGFSSYGSTILSDNKWDLAMIVVSKPPSSVPPLPIARSMPKPGDPLWIAGHGGGSYRQAGGRCVRYLAPEIPKNGTAPLYEIIDLSVNARQGDSGGPILNRDGELAGVLFGSDMVKNTAGSCCERVSRFLNQARPQIENLPKRPEVHFALTEPQGPRHQLRDSLRAATPAEIPPHSSGLKKFEFGGTSAFGVRSSARRQPHVDPPRSVPLFNESDASPSPVRAGETSSGPNSVGGESLSPTSFQGPDHFAPPQSGVGGIRTASWTEPVSSETKNLAMTGNIRPLLQSSHLSKDTSIPEKYQEIDLVEHELVPGIPNAFDSGLASLNPSNRNEQEGNSWLPTLQGIQSSGNAVAFDKYGRLDDEADAAEFHSKEKDHDCIEVGLTTVSQRSDLVHPTILAAFVVLILFFVCFSIRLLKRNGGRGATWHA